MTETLDHPDFAAVTTTTGYTTAVRNWAANVRALRETQPAILDQLDAFPEDAEYVFARDGSLTVIEEGGRWWAGCSLPGRAAKFMLQKAELPGTVICFLYPVHAAQLRVALDRMLPGQGLLALVPQSRTLRIMLACEDLSSDIAAHRLYFAAGKQWDEELDRLLDENVGLPTPTQFIRPILADISPADALVEPAQKVFADHSRRRAEGVREIRQNWAPAGLRRICVVAPSHFRLWDDIGAALASAMNDGGERISTVRFDSDDPASASAALMAAAAAKCDAIVTPNTSRADLPDLIPDDMPWVTWLTTPRIPSVERAGPNDTLLVADPDWKELAAARGWREDRVFVADWPDMPNISCPAEQAASPGVFQVRDDPFLAIISDICPLDPPPRVTEYSSHRILWEAIRDQLLEDPFAMKDTPDKFLSHWMRKARVEEEGFSRALFLDGVVLHAWQRGIARAMVRAGLPVKLFGNGWAEADDLRGRAAGPVRSRTQFESIVRSAAALVHVQPHARVHPIESAGKPVVRAHQQRNALLRDARRALNGSLPAQRRAVERLSARIIHRALKWSPK